MSFASLLDYTASDGESVVVNDKHGDRCFSIEETADLVDAVTKPFHIKFNVTHPIWSVSPRTKGLIVDRVSTPVVTWPEVTRAELAERSPAIPAIWMIGVRDLFDRLIG
jgi:hypothetical protein